MRAGAERLWAYNCEDACRTFEVDEAQQQAVVRMGLQGPHEFQQRLFKPVFKMMERGILVDESARKQLFTELQQAELDSYNWLKEVIGHDINIDSPKQVAELFYNELGQAAYHNRKTGGVTTDDETLDKIAMREPLLRPVVEKIAELRSLGVFTSTFLTPLADEDGRLRAAFNIAGTVTFRFSSNENVWGTGTNLQNWSAGKVKKAGTKPPPNIRRVLIPDPGHVFFDIDLSAADLRIVTWESDCKPLKEMFAAGLRPYTELSKEYYDDTSIKKGDPRDELFKRVAHATNYLGQAKTVAPKVGLAIPAVERLQAWYFTKFPEIHAWQEKIKAQLISTGRIRNAFGYQRTFFDRIEGQIFNEAIAWIPQSTVAILINHGLINIDENLPLVQTLLQVHDSLGGQFPQKHMEMKEAIVEQCTVPIPYKDPLIIPVGIKLSTKSWGDCS